MLREGQINQLFEAHLADAGNDIQEAQKRVGDQIGRLIDKGELKPTELSFKALFESLCNKDRDVDVNDSSRVVEAMTASAFPYITSKAISKVLIDSYDYALGDVSSLVTEVPSNRAAEDIPGLTAGDNLDLVGESAPYHEVTIKEKRCRITNFKFGKIIALTKEMMLFDQTGRVLEQAKRIGEKGGLHRHSIVVKKCASLACSETGEAADTSLVYDGTARALYANDHSAWDTQTNDNISTTAFGFTGVDELLQLLLAQKDDRGDAIVVTAKQLLVPVQLQTKALQLVGSEWEYGTANRNINPYKGKYQVIATPILTSAGVYYLGDFARQMRWQWVWEPITDTLMATSESAFTNDILQQFKFSYMGGCGALDHRFAAKGGS